jgi:stress response protein SCP2
VILFILVATDDETTFQLIKGANVALEHLDAELGSVTVILETGDAQGAPVDADVSVLLLGSDGRVRSNDDLVFYNNPVALAGAVHLRDKIRSEPDEDGHVVSADLLTLDLDEVPDVVQRIVLAASIDPSLDLAFGQARFVRLRLQRTSDAQLLLEYCIDDASTELALLFAEFYRRNEQWRIRAIGQGYQLGLPALINDFGIDVESSSETDLANETDALPGEVPTSPDSDPSNASATPPPTLGPEDKSAETRADDARPPGQVSVRRVTRAPRMPADWNATVPAEDGSDLKPARLFPVAGIGTGEEQERRASSALLAVMPLVREFGRALLGRFCAPAGVMRTYVEVPFGHEDQPYRPDGLITVTRGQREWTALVEVKTSTGFLDVDQIDAYVEIARKKGFDAVITISNQVTGAADDHPVPIARSKLRKVALHHLSWDEIRTQAILLTKHREVADPTQRIVLEEFVRYMQHDRSGLHGFTDMGKRWVGVRDSVKARTLRPSEVGTLEVSAAFDQLVRHVALHLTSLLGVEVQTIVPRSAPDSTSRCQQLADSGLLFGSLRVPGAVNAMTLIADLRADRVTCSINVDAPRDGRPLTRVNWILRQLTDARPGIRVEASTGNTRNGSTAKLLNALRDRPESLIPADGRDIRSFRIGLDLPMGAKRGIGRGSLIGSVIAVTDTFYAEVVQHLRPWNARPPQMPAPTGST